MYFAVPLFAWIVGVDVLTRLLRAHLRDPRAREFFGLLPRRVYVVDLFRPALFTAQGNRLRRLAAAWFLLGPLLVVVGYWVEATRG